MGLSTICAAAKAGLIQPPRRRARPIAIALMTPLAAALFQRLHHWAGNRVGDAQPAAKVFKGVAERVERCDHAGAALTIASMSIHSAMLAGFNDIDVPKPRPRECNLVVSVEELLFPSRLHLETHGIERSHDLPLFADAARTPADSSAIVRESSESSVYPESRSRPK
jgi:hypothetical protein